MQPWVSVAGWSGWSGRTTGCATGGPADRTPTDFRIECYLGHGGAEGVVVRGRVVDDPEPSEAVEGERVHARPCAGCCATS